MKYFVIVNPVSGRGLGAKLIPLIEKTLTEFGLDFQLSITKQRWHAAELAELAAKQEYDVVVCAGGDGTANEAINGLMIARAQGFKKTAFGLLSVGTGNDLAASLKLPVDLREAIQILKTGTRHWIDIGIAKGEA